jgi:hypothetical protein
VHRRAARVRRRGARARLAAPGLVGPSRASSSVSWGKVAARALAGRPLTVPPARPADGCRPAGRRWGWRVLDGPRSSSTPGSPSTTSGTSPPASSWVSPHQTRCGGKLEAVALRASPYAETDPARHYLLHGGAGLSRFPNRGCGLTRLPSALAEVRDSDQGQTPSRPRAPCALEQLSGAADGRSSGAASSSFTSTRPSERTRSVPVRRGRRWLTTARGKRVRDAIREEDRAEWRRWSRSLMEERAAQARVASRTALASTGLGVFLRWALRAGPWSRSVLWLLRSATWPHPPAGGGRFVARRSASRFPHHAHQPGRRGDG